MESLLRTSIPSVCEHGFEILFYGTNPNPVSDILHPKNVRYFFQEESLFLGSEITIAIVYLFSVFTAGLHDFRQMMRLYGNHGFETDILQ